MNYLVSPLAAGAYVIAIVDARTWDVRSYTNLYVLQRNRETILIDAGLKDYQSSVVAALAKIGVTPDSVTHVLLTHGHLDHAEGANIFVHAKKFIHNADFPLLPPELASQFVPFTPQTGDFALTADGLSELDIVLVNTHSPGSVAIYDQLSKALFVGDFFCYFGESLPEGELVAYSSISRQGSCQYVAAQAASGDADFQHFTTGLSKLLCYQPEFFCTGHGVVLCNDIQIFLKNMWLSATQK